MSFLWGKSVAFSPDKDIPKLDGKVILVTGGTLSPLLLHICLARY